jgi:8-oxo-dGTP pyrophosphatase MutT (NUDIX family)
VTSAEASGTEGRPVPIQDDAPRFRPTGEEVVHRGRIITVTRATFVDPEGVAFERDVVRHPEAVVLVRQYRPAIDRWTLEVPAGTCDVDGEPPAETARRELAEEAGYAPTELVLLTRCAITPGFCDEFSWVYLATGLTSVDLDRQGVEEHYMRVELVPLARFDAMVDDGTVIDATTILGVGLARRRWPGGR